MFILLVYSIQYSSLSLWCAAGYDSERDSSDGMSGDEEGEEEEEEERKGEEGERDGSGGGGKMEGGDVWSYNLMTESHSGSHSSDNVLRVDRDIRGHSEPHDMKVFSDESSTTQTTEPSEKRRNSRALLERLKLVRRSKSPGEYRETSDSGEVKKKAVLGGERTSGSDTQQLVVFGKEGSTEGERGGTGVEGAGGEEIESERKGKEWNKQTEDVDRDDPTFTLALISRRSRHRAGEGHHRFEHLVCSVRIPPSPLSIRYQVSQERSGFTRECRQLCGDRDGRVITIRQSHIYMYV